MRLELLSSKFDLLNTVSLVAFEIEITLVRNFDRKLFIKFNIVFQKIGFMQAWHITSDLTGNPKNFAINMLAISDLKSPYPPQIPIILQIYNLLEGNRIEI